MSELFDPSGPMPQALPALFSRTSTGAVHQWTVLVLGNSYYTIHGQQGGKLQTSEPTVCKPKNEGKKNGTSGEQQALREADALWKKKKAAGSYEDIADIDSVGFTEPMLAKKFEDYVDELKFPVYSSFKMDGFRCVARKDGLWSRNGKKYASIPHIEEALKPFFDKHPDIILDGELYCDKFANDFNAICSLVKKTRPTAEDHAASKASVQYWIYDWINTEFKFDQRYEVIKNAVKFADNDAIKLVNSIAVHNLDTLTQLYEIYISHGYEGQMIRTNDVYQNKRSKYLLKRKEFQDAEFKIMGVVEGEGNKTGMVGALVFENERQVQFNSNVKGTREYLIELWRDRDSLIGKLATVKYFNLTPLTDNGGGVPRFPYVTALRQDFDT